MTIIPATDIIDGKCVRLTKGDYSLAKVYYPDPVDAAKCFADCGITRLHIVDLDGAAASSPRNLRTLERIANATDLSLQFGGGIKSADALRSVFSAGAARAICGSVAIKNPGLLAGWLGEFGADRIILGADVRDGRISVSGWTEDVDRSAADLIREFAAHGLAHTIVTDISRDGMLCGTSADFYTALQSQFPDIEVTVSGGISSVDDIMRLAEAGLRSVIVGKAIYEGRITFKDLELCLQNV